MTVATEACSVQVIGNGVQTSFTYDFLIPSEGETQLWLTDSTGIPSLVNVAGYTINDLGNPNGGTFVYPTSGDPLPARPQAEAATRRAHTSRTPT